MKKITIMTGAGLLLASLAVSAMAYEPITFGSDTNTSSSTSNSGFGSSNQSGYESSSGNRYQYNLSDPGDSIEYELDSSAQRRDRMNVDPTVDIDRGLNEHGGGIYD